MKNQIYRQLLTRTVIFGIALLAIAPAQAENSPNLLLTPSKSTSIAQSSDPINLTPGNSLDQINSVSQLRDVQPTDWAYEALKSLVERYRCVTGYPDQTFRGNRALTRWEFAGLLNACIEPLTKLLQENNGVRREDIDKLNQLTKQFSTELATLGKRIDNLESRNAYLKAHQFSSTTKLTGEAIFAFTGAYQGSTKGSIPVFQDRLRLVLESSFTGKDILTIRLAAGNGQRLQFPGYPSNAEGNQTFNLPPGNNSINLDWLSYEFPINDRLYVYIPAYSGRWWDFAPVFNPVLGGGTGGKKALSIFAQFNPIYTIGGGEGIGLNYKLTKKLTLSGGYFAGDDVASNPSSGNGLFNGEYSALGQLAWSPNDQFGIAFTYINAYQPNGPIFDFGTGGTKIGNAPANTPFSGRAATNSYGTSGFYRFSPRFTVNGFFGYTDAENPKTHASADIWYYGLGLGLPDLGKKGNLGGIVVGAEPYLRISSS